MKKLFLGLSIGIALIGCDPKTADNSMADNDSTKVIETESEQLTHAPDSATAMNNWMAYMTPGEEHKMLASWDGTWTGEATMWEAPNTEPQKSTIAALNKMLLGGRYQEGKHTGSMMGQPFEGISMTGYDNDKKEFVSTWIDNFGTGLMMMSGKWDPATKTIDYHGKMVDPMAGDGKEKDYHQIVTVIDNDHQKMEMFAIGADGKEWKTMEIISSRK